MDVHIQKFQHNTQLFSFICTTQSLDQKTPKLLVSLLQKVSTSMEQVLFLTSRCKTKASFLSNEDRSCWIKQLIYYLSLTDISSLCILTTLSVNLTSPSQVSLGDQHFLDGKQELNINNRWIKTKISTWYSKWSSYNLARSQSGQQCLSISEQSTQRLCCWVFAC